MQQNKLYVGNLSYSVDESQIKELFEAYGPIDRVTLIKDRNTGKSKGFAFVTFETEEDAEKALEQNGQEFTGRSLRVNVAKERSDR
ncbi:MAG: RNA-binding protein, partial [Chitinispirillia bacterium]